MIHANRYHDFSYGHRVYGHESKCANLHGHNGRATFHCASKGLDSVGRVIDFSVIKSTLCQWLEDNWDHRFLVFNKDPALAALREIDESVVAVPFNPTAENMAQYLLDVVGPSLLSGTGVTLTIVEMMETRKCGVCVGLKYEH